MQSLVDREELKDGSVSFKIWHTRERDKGHVAISVVWTADANRIFVGVYQKAVGRSDALGRMFAEMDVNRKFVESLPVEHLIGIRLVWLERVLGWFGRLLLERVDERFVIDGARMNEILAKLEWNT